MTIKPVVRRATAAFATAIVAAGGVALAPSAHAGPVSAETEAPNRAPAAVGWLNVLTWEGAKTQACGRPTSTPSGDVIAVWVRTNNRKGTAKAESSFTTVNHQEPGPNNWLSTGFVAPGKISKMVSRSFNANHRAYYQIKDAVGGTAMRKLRVDNLPECPAGVGV